MALKKRSYVSSIHRTNRSLRCGIVGTTSTAASGMGGVEGAVVALVTVVSQGGADGSDLSYRPLAPRSTHWQLQLSHPPLARPAFSQCPRASQPACKAQCLLGYCGCEAVGLCQFGSFFRFISFSSVHVGSSANLSFFQFRYLPAPNTKKGPESNPYPQPQQKNKSPKTQTLSCSPEKESKPGTPQT